MSNEDVPQMMLKSYRGPWNKKGPILLVCRKCQRKLKHEGNPLVALRKLLKKRSKRLGFDRKLLIIETPCLRVCPRGGVTVCTQAQAGEGECSILRQSGDVDLLVMQCIRESSARKGGEPDELAASV